MVGGQNLKYCILRCRVDDTGVDTGVKGPDFRQKIPLLLYCSILDHFWNQNLKETSKYLLEISMMTFLGVVSYRLNGDDIKSVLVHTRV